MGKPDYEEFLSGIPSQPDGPKKLDDTPLSEPADQRDSNEPPGKTEPSNLSDPLDPSENSEQPDPSGHAKQSGKATQSKQASTSKQPDGLNQASQSRQSTPPRRANQSDQSSQPEPSNQSDPSEQSGQSEQPEELITFSVRMPTGYIECIKAITWWERCTHRTFLEDAVERYRLAHGQKHLDKIIADYNNHNS
ncbi:hypothetical protein DYD21_18590 [Rhodohalobacter sp. SW132]|uniref:hypothetical protein n=1 Tax=Rhodohalobacter sp. SW132 TaxID=2293433 RepID=UPI000E2761C9|nr:hypothetical protein [Rhodohalobacter sp. SW132]REL24219.1 hypothetical protein DYD21_18590 [Rhodohalobacter sp. SW132]